MVFSENRCPPWIKSVAAFSRYALAFLTTSSCGSCRLHVRMNWPGVSFRAANNSSEARPNIGVPLNLSPDNLYGFGRIFHGNDVNDGLEIATVPRLGCHSHKAAISHMQNIPRGRESNRASLQFFNQCGSAG